MAEHVDWSESCGELARDSALWGGWDGVDLSP